LNAKKVKSRKRLRSEKENKIALTQSTFESLTANSYNNRKAIEVGGNLDSD
jgi:hypothetical protein